MSTQHCRVRDELDLGWKALIEDVIAAGKAKQLEAADLSAV